jgi:hypothetical protein
VLLILGFGVELPLRKDAGWVGTDSVVIRLDWRFFRRDRVHQKAEMSPVSSPRDCARRAISAGSARSARRRDFCVPPAFDEPDASVGADRYGGPVGGQGAIGQPIVDGGLLARRWPHCARLAGRRR